MRRAIRDDDVEDDDAVDAVAKVVESRVVRNTLW